MAKPVITYKSSIYSTTAGPTYTCSPTWTPTANSLVVAFCVSCATSPADPTGVTGHGLTYTKLTLSANTISTTHLLSIWVANAGSSPSSTACVMTLGGSPTGGAVIEFEITGWRDVEDIINAFGKASLIETGTSTTGTTGTVTLNLRPDVTSEHVELSFWCHLANEATTPRVNWTETAGADGNFNNPATGAEGQFRTDAYELTSTATWTTSINWRGYALTVRGTATTPVENVKISDTLTATITPIFANISSENLKLQDDVLNTPRLSPGTLWMDRMFEDVQAEERIYGAAVFVASQNTLTTGLQEQPLLISDSVNAEYNLDPIPCTVADENLKLDDIGNGVAQLIGVIHITDTITAELVTTAGGDLSIEVNAENLKLSESVQADENPRPVSVASENLKLSDTLTVTIDLVASKQEDLKISYSVTADENPRPVLVAQEALKLADTLTVALQLAVAVADEALRIQDTVTADENPRDVSAGTENLKLSDTLTVSRDLTAILQEDLKVQDQAVSADENPRDVSVASESLKIQDTVSTTLDPLQAAPADELLHVQDTVTAVVVIDISVAVASESMRVMDFVLGASRFVASQNTRTAGLMEDPLKLADAVTSALQLAVAVADEVLHVQDTVMADENPRPVLVAQENLKLSDSVFVTLDPEETSRTENVKISDSVATLLNPEQTSLEEVLHVQDTVTTSLNPLQAAPADELLHVQDEIFAEGGLTPVSKTESLRLTDSVFVTLDPLNAAIGEDVHVQDQNNQALDHIATIGESLKISDQVFATLDPLQASIAESCHVSDEDFIADLGGIRATLVESVHVSDAITVAMELTVTATETVRLQDIVYVNGIQLMAIAFSDERISGDVFTEESLSGDVFTAETLSGEVFTEEELEPA